MGRKSSTKKPEGQLVGWPRLITLGVAFIAGWVIMMLEILGGRVLAPYFGYSVYQWGALIGVVLAALSCGYYLGGRVGDSTYAFGFLVWSLVLSTAFILLMPTLGNSFLPQFRAYGAAWGAVVASTILLGPPSMLLAVVSPIVIRLTATHKIANTAGAVYAVSTLGSIGGTFFTAFYSIPFLGTRASHYLAAALVLIGVVGLATAGKRRWYVASIALLGLAWLPAEPRMPNGLLLHDESVHNIIHVVDTAESRYLFLNYTDAPQTTMRKNSLLTSNYYDYFLLGPHLNDGKRILFLGVAGGVSLLQLVTVYPDVEVVGVELDGAVINVAKRFFELDGIPRIHLIEGDARWYVESTPDRYDVIDIDLYVTGHIPFFCTTREFFQLVKDRLTDKGLMMINVLSMQAGEDLIGPFIRTVRSVFPSVFLIDIGNYILLASKKPIDLETLLHMMNKPTDSPVMRQVIDKARETLRVATTGEEWPIFTDDLNDVEFRSFKMSYGSY